MSENPYLQWRISRDQMLSMRQPDKLITVRLESLIAEFCEKFRQADGDLDVVTISFKAENSRPFKNDDVSHETNGEMNAA